MRTTLIRIGNSQGVRIPKAVIDQCGFAGEVEMRVAGRSLVLSPARARRHGWDAAFAAMAERGDDAPLLPDDLEQGFRGLPPLHKASYRYVSRWFVV